MTTVTIAKAKDIYAAARHTHNSIIEKRIELIDAEMKHYDAIYTKKPWCWFPHPLREQRLESLRTNRFFGGIHDAQLRHCAVIAKMCLAAQRANGDDDAEITITFADMSCIQFGWDVYMKEEELTDMRASLPIAPEFMEPPQRDLLVAGSPVRYNAAGEIIVVGRDDVVDLVSGLPLDILGVLPDEFNVTQDGRLLVDRAWLVECRRRYNQQ